MRKQCFCEAKPRHEPYRCAKEGQNCKRCNGVIFFGIYKRNGKVQNLSEMMSKNYRYKEHYNNGNFRCTNKEMGGDPNRGHYKQCFCDDLKFINIKKIKADDAYNRQQEIIRRNKRRLRLLAIQRRRRLQQEKERRERLRRQREEAERRRIERERLIVRARETAELIRVKESNEVKVREDREKIRLDEEEHRKEVEEIKQKEQAEKSKNDMIAA